MDWADPCLLKLGDKGDLRLEKEVSPSTQFSQLLGFAGIKDNLQDN